MTWFYNNHPVHEPPEGAVGFVYMITCLTTGKRYIGKKLLQFSQTRTKTVTLKNGTKKKKKIRTKVDSDWNTYYGSSDSLTADIQSIGIENFRRDILDFCTSKSACSYLEAKYQFQYEVLENSDLWYNGHIMVRVHGKHIRSKSMTISTLPHEE